MTKKNYSKKDLEYKLMDLIRPYQKKCVNYNGCDKNGVPYIEILADLILEDESRGITSYSNHIKESFYYKRKETRPSLNREKGLCRYWYNTGHFDEEIEKELGIPVEFELNIIENTKVNVDLVSYNAHLENPVAYLIEVKGRIKEGEYVYSTDETLLRCALEIKTYYESLKDKKEKIFSLNDRHNVGIKNANKLGMAILIPKGCKAEEQLDIEKYPNLNRLINKWGIKVFCYKNTKKSY